MITQSRQRLERRIVRRVILDGKKAGYLFNIYNGGEGYELSEPTARVKALLNAMFATDDEQLFFFKGGKRVGWVRFVYGNDGWDVVCDYTANLEDVMSGATILANKYS